MYVDPLGNAKQKLRNVLREGPGTSSFELKAELKKTSV